VGSGLRCALPVIVERGMQSAFISRAITFTYCCLMLFLLHAANVDLFLYVPAALDSQYVNNAISSEQRADYMLQGRL